jgi:predicted RNase H-like nuclease (RuvC/YqgF family)
MAGSDRLKSTSVNLFESDIEILEKRGIPISEAIRDILHHLVIHDSSDILYCVRRGQYGEHLKEVDERIKRLLKDKERLDGEREWIDNKIDELEGLKEMLRFNIESSEADHRHNQTIEQVMNIGLELDKIIYKCNFDEDQVRSIYEKEIQEMESINPGWSLSDHIKIRKGIFNNR